MPARILIADDHEIVREGIRNLITKSHRDWEICGEATDGEQAVKAIAALKPDVVVLDITMPKMSGLEAAAQIARLGLHSRVLMFTMHESERLNVEVRQARAQGFVLKSQAARDLIRAVDCLLGGGTFFGSECEPKAERTPLPHSPGPSGATRRFLPVIRRRSARFSRGVPYHANPVRLAVRRG
jgi:DNA-binding NarL/FixJ family response regulator